MARFSVAQFESGHIQLTTFLGKSLSLYLWSLAISYFLVLIVSTPVTDIILYSDLNFYSEIKLSHVTFCHGRKLID